MVGVPRFSIRCRSGPSARMGWPPRWRPRRRRIISGPSTREKTKAVRQAAPARKVVYCTRLKSANSRA